MGRFWLSVLCLAMCVEVGSTQTSKSTKENSGIGPEWIGPDDDSIPILIPYLNSKERVAIRTALADLATRGPKAKPAILTIRWLLKCSDTLVCIDAARTLIDLQKDTELALKTIIGAVKAKEWSTRAYAAKADTP